jgi:hypothetical protein
VTSKFFLRKWLSYCKVVGTFKKEQTRSLDMATNPVRGTPNPVLQGPQHLTPPEGQHIDGNSEGPGAAPLGRPNRQTPYQVFAEVLKKTPVFFQKAANFCVESALLASCCIPFVGSAISLWKMQHIVTEMSTVSEADHNPHELGATAEKKLHYYFLAGVVNALATAAFLGYYAEMKTQPAIFTGALLLGNFYIQAHNAGATNMASFLIKLQGGNHLPVAPNSPSDGVSVSEVQVSG